MQQNLNLQLNALGKLPIVPVPKFYFSYLVTIALSGKSYPGGVSINFHKHFLIGNIRDCMCVSTCNKSYPTPYIMYSSIHLRLISLCFDRKVGCFTSMENTLGILF